LNEYKKLSEKIFSTLRVGYIHGRMHSKDKENAMAQFAAGEIDVLVATSVIEVGVNMPNATIMMIEGAEHFGLAQLHQFRGRVGRSTTQSYCLLFPSSDSGHERLQYFVTHNDGFALAEYDLQERGPGEVYGTTQSGMMELSVATMNDIGLIEKAREIANTIDINLYPDLQEVVREFEKKVHLE
jgi:ATP-dependent DNA helicase RecG